MHLINMIKRTYYDSLGKLRILPWGFHLVNDLIPLYQIIDNFKRKPLSKEANLRLQWMDYYRKSKNVSLTCRHFRISRQYFYCYPPLSLNFLSIPLIFILERPLIDVYWVRLLFISLFFLNPVPLGQIRASLLPFPLSFFFYFYLSFS